jgi:cytochrome c
MMMPLFINKLILAAAQTPIPRDLDLPLPLDDWYLKAMLVVLFLLHILFVNLMVGGSVFTVFFEILGLNLKRYDALAQKIGQTITVNKSLAVVLGVGPLLCINLAYTTHFYTANALTGYAWWLIIPLVTLAFLLAYVHKYTWNRWRGSAKRFHMMVGGLAALLFLSIPFIFLTNINLMLFPDHWSEVEGFFSSLRIGNVFPRYFHFLTATVALTGLILAGWFGRKRFPVEKELPAFSRLELRRLFYGIAFYATIAQVIFGPLLLFTLPYVGIDARLLVVIFSGVTVAFGTLFLLWHEIKSSRAEMGLRYVLLLFLFGSIVLAMGTGRHLYRETSLAGHKALMADASAKFQAIEYATQMRLDAGLGAGQAVGVLTGKMVFQNCAACHAVNRILAAPSLVEIYSIYKGNPAGIVTWAENPGKKRPQFAQMPSMAHLGENKLELVADYMLKTGGEAAEKSEAPQSN